MKTGRRVAFDYGQVRIGVAASDNSGLIASPIATLIATDSDLLEQIAALIIEYEPIYLVVGEPKHLSGASNPSLVAAHEFAARLATITDIPIHFIDERMSTLSAARNLRSAGHDAKSSKSRIDAMAAVSILESALERERIAGHLD
ncbi:MAG: Holliday junction resolvase RuvX [Actinomycetes bacterium]|jgi:putative holliday junction resolvase